MKAADAFRETFGSEVKELNAGAIVTELRKELARSEDTVASALATLTAQRLPGAASIESASGQMKAILRGSDDNAIASFNASHRALKDAIRRAGELEQALNQPRLHDLERAREARGRIWSVLAREPDLPEGLRARAAELEDLVQRETFFKELPAIEQHTKALETEYQKRERSALEARVDAYTKAFEALLKTPGWTELGEDQQRRLAEPFERGRRAPSSGEEDRVPIPQLRADRDAVRRSSERRHPGATAHPRRRARRHHQPRRPLRGRHRDRGAARGGAGRRARGVCAPHRRRQEGPGSMSYAECLATASITLASLASRSCPRSNPRAWIKVSTISPLRMNLTNSL